RHMRGLPSITIEYLSKRSGADEGTILRYQRLGLVRRPRTVTPGLLLYTPEDVDRIRFASRSRGRGGAERRVWEESGPVETLYFDVADKARCGPRLTPSSLSRSSGNSELATPISWPW